MKPIVLKAIGRVKNQISHRQTSGWENVVSEIIIDPMYEEALAGVEEYSHLLILFWMSRLRPAEKKIKKIHPKSRPDLPLVGIFSTRTQYRPNPIGLTQVKLIKRKKNILRVQGLDAISGTPVVDIKPISPRHEFLKKYQVPEWYHRLWKKPKEQLKV